MINEFSPLEKYVTPPCFPRPSYPVQPVPIPALIVLPSNFPSFIDFLTLSYELQGIRKGERRLNSMVVKNKKALESEIQLPSTPLL